MNRQGLPVDALIKAGVPKALAQLMALLPSPNGAALVRLLVDNVEEAYEKQTAGEPLISVQLITDSD